MQKQSFVWTCLPNGISQDGRQALVSLLLSPRLDPGDQPPVLASFAEWLDWPAALEGARVAFLANGVPVATHLLTIRAAGEDESRSGPDSEVWKALFRPELPLVAHEHNRNLLESDVLSYSAADINELVRELYKDLATRAGGALPRIGSDLLKSPAWGELVQAVAAVDRWGTPTDDPLDFRTSRLPRGEGKTSLERRYSTLQALMGLSPAGTIATNLQAKTAHLARFELFHTPPLRPKSPERVEREDDRRITAATERFERPALPSTEALVADMHFHRVIAAMNAYPTLLRRLGLVLDFAIERSSLPLSADFRLRALVAFRAGALATQPESETGAVTRASHTAAGFFAKPNPTLGAEATRVKLGLLDLYSAPNRYAVLQADVDGAGLKLMNFARTLGGYQEGVKAAPALLNDEVSRKEKQAGAPALRTAGLMLAQSERAASLKLRLKANHDHAAAAASDSPEFFAEDLTRGYRVDVWDTRVRAWRSLCRRSAEYLLDAGTLLVTPESGEEEGTVQLAATRAPDKDYNPKLLNLHEAVVSWTGWSLAAPPPGLGIGKDDVANQEKPELSAEAELPPGIDFRSRFKPVPGSLPRLRYGRRYDLRARAVDLAGNSLPPLATSFGPELPDFGAQPFSRFEPLLAPVLALVRPAGGVTEKPREGESMGRLAIRSFNAQFDDATPSAEIARRYAVPPQSTAREAELHGMLDTDGVLDSKTFALLAHEKDHDAGDPQAALVEERIALHGPLDRTPVDTTFAVWKEGSELSYLPDPLADCVTACFIHHPTLAFEESVHIPLYAAGARWPDAQPFRIELFEDALAKPVFDKEQRVLRVPLGKGERATLRLSMRLDKTDLHEKMGLWQWLDPATQQRIEADTIDGRHWMFTPYQELELVHAVQRPLLRPELEALNAERGFGETATRPRFHAICSLKSTDRLDLLAHWHEPVEDLSQKAPTDREQHALPFHVKISEARDHVASGDALQDHAPPVPGRPDRIEVNGGTDFVAPKRHEFGDTRYRRVDYQLLATTRYREYLPGTLPLTLEGTKAVTWVKSSAPPAAPQVLYLVPTFGWTRTRGADGSLRSWRRGGGLRVYLDRPWNLTGYGEMLAVVLPRAGFAGDPNSLPSTAPYKKYVTQWGSDPIWDSPSVPGIAPRRSDFPLARLQPDPAGTWLPPGAPSTEADQRPGPFECTELIPPNHDPSNRVDIAPHDVFYDPERELWYADVEVAPGRAYWPWIRLALARYQPTSVLGAHLSDVVLADFMQLANDRSLTVRSEKAGTVRHVTVYGFGYDDSAGAREARQGPRVLHDFESQSYVSIEPAPVARNSVVEVFLEQLDPTLGEDFGWLRIASGTRASARKTSATVTRHPGEAQLLTPERRLETAELLKARRFQPALSAGAIEQLFATPELWDGRVTLPAECAEGVRFRIAIEEYEEYPIDRESEPSDGTDPSSPTRTRTGRRLVFVEHVELDA